MSRRIFTYHFPDRCIIGTIGEYPEQSFYLQVTEYGDAPKAAAATSHVPAMRETTVQLDPAQVRLIAKRCDQLLTNVSHRFNIPLPPRALHVFDLHPLHMPIDCEFLVGTIGMGWDVEQSALALEVMAYTDVPIRPEMMMQEGDEGPDTLQIKMSPRMARQFARRAFEVFLGGRHCCPLCSEPLDTEGHICGRLNGYRRDLGGSVENLSDYLS